MANKELIINEEKEVDDLYFTLQHMIQVLNITRTSTPK